MRKRKSFLSLLLTALTAFVLSLGAGIMFSVSAVTANAGWTNDGGVDHYTDMTSNGEDLEYYDTLYNADWDIYNGSNNLEGDLSSPWDITNDKTLRFTPSASNTTGSFVWKFTYTCTTASTGMYIYPLSSGSWNGADLFDFGSCGFTAGNSYEVELGVVKVKNNDDYYVFVKVDDVFKIGTYRAASAKKGNDLYFYLTGGSGTTVSERPIEYETYDTLYNADLGLSGNWSLTDDTYVSFTPSASNTTGSFVWAFEYACTAAGTVNIYPLAGGSWPSNGNSTVFNLNACGFTAGSTYAVELGILKIKNSSNYQIYVTVNGEEKINVTRDESLKQGNGLYFYVVGAAGTLVSEKAIDYSIFEPYDVLYNEDLGLAESWAIKDDTFINFVPSSENTTGSFIWKFSYTCTTASMGMYIYPLASGSWKGATQIDFGSCGFVAGNTYEVEFGVLQEKGATDYTILVVVDGKAKINETRTRAHTGNCGTTCTDLTAHTGLYFYITGGAGTLVSEKPRVEYEDYIVVENSDMGMAESVTFGDYKDYFYTGTTSNTTTSMVYKTIYKQDNASAQAIGFRSAKDAWGGSCMFLFQSGGIICTVNGVETTVGGIFPDLGAAYEVELGAIDIKNTNTTWVYIKVNGTEVFSVVTAKFASSALNLATWGGGSTDAFDEYSYEVVFKGVETRTIVNGKALGELPAAPIVIGKDFSKWTDSEGNEITASTIVTSGFTATAQYTVSSLSYEDYVTVQNSDVGAATAGFTDARYSKYYSYPTTNATTSMVYKFNYTTSVATYVALRDTNGGWGGYQFIFVNGAVQYYVNGTQYTASGLMNEAKAYAVQLGAIDIKGTDTTWIFVVIDGVTVVSETTAKVASTGCGFGIWGAGGSGTFAQYSWNVTVNGETYEIPVGESIGDKLDGAVVEGYTFGSFTDENGNAVTSETVPSSHMNVTVNCTYKYTITNEAGAVLSNGTHIYGEDIEYDGNTLTNGENVFTGYLVNEKLYDNLQDAVSVAAKTKQNIVAMMVGLGLIDGASIRLSATNASIRFTSAINIADVEKVLDFGILMTTEEVRQTLGEFTIAGLSGVDSSLYYNYNKNSGNLRYVENEDYANQYVYSLVLDKVSKSNYGVKYTARAYVLVEYADGTQAYVYGEFDEENHVRSMYDVASAAIVDTEADYTDTQKTIIQKYIDGVIDLNAYLELQGRERNYTVSISDIDANGDYTVTVTPKNGFDITGIGAIYVEGVKVAVSAANVSAGTFKISESDMSASILEAFEQTMAERNDITALQISAYSGPSLGVKQTAANTIVAGGYAATYDDLKTYMEAGFDSWYVEVSCLSAVTGYTAKGTTYQGDTPTYDVYRALDLAAQYANETGKPCPVYINIPHLTGMVMDEVEAGKTWIKLIYDIFTNYNDGVTTAANSPVNGMNQLGGFMLCDEPTLADYDKFAAVFNEIAYNCGAIAVGYDFNCALLQTYAGSDRIGSSYATYVNKYAALMQDTRISFDNYPFYYVSKDGLFNDSSENLMEDSWYSDMQAVRANANGTGTCIQSFTAGAQESGWLTKTTKYKNIDKEAEISMQVYTALAYGFTNLDYFVYWDTMNRAMMEAEGETGEVYQKTPIMWNDANDWSKGYYQSEYYGWIQNTNVEAKNLFEILNKFTSTGVQLINGSSSCSNDFGSATTTNTTNAITVSATYDMVVGGFSADGYNGYLAVNVDFPDDNGTRTNTATFTVGTEYSKAIVYVNGEAKVVRVAKDGKLSLNIGCGEGVFIVPIV